MINSYKWVVLNAVARNIIKELKQKGMNKKIEVKQHADFAMVVDRHKHQALAAGFKRTDILVEIGRINGRITDNRDN